MSAKTTRAFAMDELLRGEWQTSAGNYCSDLTRAICTVSQDELGRRDALAATRLIIACLSLIGSVSIIASVLVKRQLLSPKIHPIFVLSVADLLLAVLWVAGPCLWLRRDMVTKRVWCFSVTLPTVILECISVNLTLVYALHAYSSVKLQGINNSWGNLNGPAPVERDRACGLWHPLKTITVYFVAWILPVILVMVPFGSIAGQTYLVKHANSCSCWCVPVFGNVVPLAFHSSQQSSEAADYIVNVRKLILSYAVIVSANYLVVFILLVAIYYRIWLCIRNMKKSHEENRTVRYGTKKLLIDRAQSQAKTRITYFLNVFVITGLFNFILSTLFVYHEARKLKEDHYHTQSSLHSTTIVLLFLQSTTVPLQGFLNAIVYGWTREEFVNTISGIVGIADERTPIYPTTPETEDLTSEPIDATLLISAEPDDSAGDARDTDVQETEFEDDDD